MGFGKSLELILKSRDITITDFAKKVNVSPNTLYSLISRDGNKVDIDLFNRICRALNIEPRVFSVRSDFEELSESLSDQTIAAHFDGDEYTEEELKEIKQFAEFIKSKRKDSSTSTPLEPVAAHERTDIAVTEEMKKHDDDIMNGDDF